MINRNYTGPIIPADVATDGDVRTAFKIYLIVIAPLIAFLGGLCLQQYVRIRLLRGQSVPLSATTGWIHGPGIVKMAWELRTLPGGWLGWLMILTSLFTLAADLGVANAVTQVYDTTTRIQPTGMIVGTEGKSNPSPNQRAAMVALEAQRNSWNNANLTKLAKIRYGIYKFVPDDANFMARSEEIIGNWDCFKTTPRAIIYNDTFKGNDTEMKDRKVRKDLFERGLVNNLTSYTNVSILINGTSTGPSRHLWIASVNSTKFGDPFNLKFGVGVKDIDGGRTKHVKTWHCELQSRDSNNTVLSIMKRLSSARLLEKWGLAMAGAAWPGMDAEAAYTDDSIQSSIELYLNAATMVAGARELVETENVDELEYSVFRLATEIPFWVIGLCTILFCWVIFLFGLYIRLCVICRALRIAYDSDLSQHHISAKEVMDNAPCNLLDWMSHAAYESRDAEKIPEATQLKDWILSTTWHSRRLGIVRKSEHGQVNSKTTPNLDYSFYGGDPMASAYTNYGFVQSDVPLVQKKGQYTSVRTTEMK